MLYSERHNCHNVINCTQLCISLSLYLSRCTIVCTSYHIVPRNLSLQRPSLCAGALMRELPRTRSTRTLKTSAAECKVLYITIYIYIKLNSLYFFSVEICWNGFNVGQRRFRFHDLVHGFILPSLSSTRQYSIELADKETSLNFKPIS